MQCEEVYTMLPHGSKKNVFPPLGNTPPIRGRVIVITRTDKNKEGKILSLQEISPFLLNKHVTNYCGDVKRAKLMKNGSLFVECKSEQQAEKLLTLKKLEKQLNVEAIEHETLNISKCVFNCYELKHIETEVILNELQKTDGKLMKIQRFSKKKNGKKVETNTFLLTYKGPNPPTEVKVGFNLIKTRMFYPSPLRCYNCLDFGHFAKNCKRVKVCAKCSEPFHDGNCSGEIKCAVCKKAHHTLSEKCEQKANQLLIIKTKVDNNIDYHEAKIKVENFKRAEYAEVVKKNNEPNTDEDYKLQIEALKIAVHSLQEDNKKMKTAAQSQKNETKKIIDYNKALEEENKRLSTELAKTQQQFEKAKKMIEEFISQNTDSNDDTDNNEDADNSEDTDDSEEEENNNKIADGKSLVNETEAECSNEFITVESRKTRKNRKRQRMELEAGNSEQESENSDLSKENYKIRLSEIRRKKKENNTTQFLSDRPRDNRKWQKNLNEKIRVMKTSD